MSNERKDPMGERKGAPRVSRRDFIGRVLIVGATGATASAVTWGFYNRPEEQEPQARKLPDHRVASPGPKMATVFGPSPRKSVRAAMDALGGMKRFVGKGDVVLIKPNVGWDRIPDQAANTDPDVVAELVRLCLREGAKEVMVADVPCNDPQRCFTRSGIEKAAGAAGARILFPPVEYLPVDLGGKVLGEWGVFEPLVRADRVINVPVVKHHGLSKTTIGMKNWFGILGKRRFLLHQSIHDSIVDLALAVKPTLTVVDATRVLLRNGPQGGSLSDVKAFRALAAGTDSVALDAWGARLLGLGPQDVPYLLQAQSRGLGTTDWKSLGPKEIVLG